MEKEKGKKIREWYDEEMFGFAQGTILSLIKSVEKRKSLIKKTQEGQELSEDEIFDFFESNSESLTSSMKRVLRGYKQDITDTEAIEIIYSYLRSENINKIPTLRVGSWMYAGLADLASKGMEKLPTEGVVNDIDIISGLLPYCDAIFLDNQNNTILSDGRIKDKLKVNARVFSKKNKQDFLDYLDEIIKNIPIDHLKLLEDYYGKDWGKPYLTILEDKYLD